MYKILVGLFISIVLVGCSNDTAENTESSNSEIDNQEMKDKDLEKTDAESSVVENEEGYASIDIEELDGTYLFTSEDRRSNVQFDNGIIRFSDGEGNINYRIANNGDRLVLSGDLPKVYLIKNTSEGYELVNIDDTGKVTGENINLVNR